MSVDVEVLLNRAVVDHDIALVVGPVLPHEVVGMSGGNKYFFPGVAGQEIIDVSHWLGALITSAEIIGTTGVTPVRALIDEGAALIPAETYAFCVVTAESPDGARLRRPAAPGAARCTRSRSATASRRGRPPRRSARRPT